MTHKSQMCRKLRVWILTAGLVMGLGVGRSPPPGIIPATALAGASSDKALASSGIEPTAEIKTGVRTRT